MTEWLYDFKEYRTALMGQPKCSACGKVLLIDQVNFRAATKHVEITVNYHCSCGLTLSDTFGWAVDPRRLLDLVSVCTKDATPVKNTTGSKDRRIETVAGIQDNS